MGRRATRSRSRARLSSVAQDFSVSGRCRAARLDSCLVHHCLHSVELLFDLCYAEGHWTQTMAVELFSSCFLISATPKDTGPRPWPLNFSRVLLEISFLCPWCNLRSSAARGLVVHVCRQHGGQPPSSDEVFQHDSVGTGRVRRVWTGAPDQRPPMRDVLHQAASFTVFVGDVWDATVPRLAFGAA